MVAHWIPSNRKQALAGEKKKFFKADEDPNVLSSKASGLADPELCKTDGRKWGVIEVGDSMQWELEVTVCQPNLLPRGFLLA